MDIQALAQAECSDEHVNLVLEKFAEEMKLFEVEKQDVQSSPAFNVGIVEERQMHDKPPGVALFTKKNHHIYTEYTLIWKAKEIEKSKMSCLKHSEVRKLIKSGPLQRKYLHPRHTIRYVFHILASTTDDTLRYPAYTTLCHMIQTGVSGGTRLHQDLYIALDNFGADLSKIGWDVSSIQRSMIPPPPPKTPNITLAPNQFKDTLRLILQFFSMVLAESSSSSSSDGEVEHQLSPEELDELIQTFIAVGLDPKVVETGLDHHIANCITHCLVLYPTDLVFNESVQDLVKKLVIYCDFDPHNVAYVCCRHILPSTRGSILKSSLAFFQVQICLQVEKKVVLNNVELKDVTSLVEEKLKSIQEEKEGFILYFIIKLLDFCVYQEPHSYDQKQQVTMLIRMLRPIVAGIRDNVDDLNLTVVRFYAAQVLDKWSSKRD